MDHFVSYFQGFVQEMVNRYFHYKSFKTGNKVETKRCFKVINQKHEMKMKNISQIEKVLNTRRSEFETCKCQNQKQKESIILLCSVVWLTSESTSEKYLVICMPKNCLLTVGKADKLMVC